MRTHLPRGPRRPRGTRPAETGGRPRRNPKRRPNWPNPPTLPRPNRLRLSRSRTSPRATGRRPDRCRRRVSSVLPATNSLPHNLRTTPSRTAPPTKTPPSKSSAWNSSAPRSPSTATLPQTQSTRLSARFLLPPPTSLHKNNQRKDHARNQNPNVRKPPPDATATSQSQKSTTLVVLQSMPNLHRHSSQPIRTSRETKAPSHPPPLHRSNLLHNPLPAKSSATGKERRNLMSSVTKPRRKLPNSTGSTPSLPRLKTRPHHRTEPKSRSAATMASRSRRCSPPTPTSTGSSIAAWTASGAPPTGKSSALP